MKCVKLLLSLVLICGLMSSCYTSRVYHGNMAENDPKTEVNAVKNQILLWGLLPLKSSNQKAKDYVAGKKDYMVQTNWTFVDGLLNCITFGIYTPTTTTYYLPAK